MHSPAPHHTRLRVLALDEEFPFPLDSGKRIRSWNLLRRLAQRHDITLVCYGPVADEARQCAHQAGIILNEVEELPLRRGAGLYLDLFRNLFSPYPYSVDKHHTRRFSRAVQRLAEGGHFDLLHCEWAPYAIYQAAARRLPVSVSAHNVEAQIWQRRAEHSQAAARWFFRQQANKMWRFEISQLESAHVMAVSEQDAQMFRKAGLGHVTVVDNGVDLHYFQPQGAGGDDVLFMASLDWFPNQDALRYFLREVMPHILIERPTCRVRVAGRRAPAELREWITRQPNVDFIGEVADVRPELARAAAAVVPLRIGGGSRIKILESLAAGRAVVSTSVGAEGLRLRNGEHIVLADSAADFARAVLDLLASPELRERLGRQGRTMVEAEYGWDALALKMEAAWLSAAGHSQACAAEAAR